MDEVLLIADVELEPERIESIIVAHSVRVRRITSVTFE